MNIHDYDVFVIRFGTVYLVAMPYTDTKVCRLSENKYDALQIDDEQTARKLANLTGGDAILFNPITGHMEVTTHAR